MSQPCGACVPASAAGALAGAIASALEQTAHDLAEDVEATEQLAARLPPTPGIADTVAKLKRRAELVGIASAYFKEMAERPETPVEFDRTVFGVPGVTTAPVTKP